MCRENQYDDPEDCLALAPYLDMFNHSASADVEAGVDLVGGGGDSRDHYQIVSNVGFERHSEVFISYGRHGNTGRTPGFKPENFLIWVSMIDEIKFKFNMSTKFIN